MLTVIPFPVTFCQPTSIVIDIVIDIVTSSKCCRCYCVLIYCVFFCVSWSYHLYDSFSVGCDLTSRPLIYKCIHNHDRWANGFSTRSEGDTPDRT